ncbi:hypothetical protein GW17_00044811 [Ensete ventricosum]|nr:hypothetical protein GW17_00044811 [Ensete ventricosum]RZS13210.1 hypothetical protein BHM03_00044757 [Ensete ventricosum]
MAATGGGDVAVWQRLGDGGTVAGGQRALKGGTAVEATIEEEEGSGGKHDINNGGDDLHGLQGEINCLRKRRRSRLSWKKASVLPSNVSGLKASGMPRQRNEEADGVQREKRKPLSSLIHHQFI